jgi:hypothetical protein
MVISQLPSLNYRRDFIIGARLNFRTKFMWKCSDAHRLQSPINGQQLNPLQPNKFFPTMEKTTLESCILFTTKFILRRDTIWMAADGAGIVLSKKKRSKVQKVLPSGETGFGGGGEASNL